MLFRSTIPQIMSDLFDANFMRGTAQILEKVDDGQMGVILKRMMMRAASKVAERYGVQALVTGEALGQVSSQTLTNLRLIDGTQAHQPAAPAPPGRWPQRSTGKCLITSTRIQHNDITYNLAQIELDMDSNRLAEAQQRIDRMRTLYRGLR